MQAPRVVANVAADHERVKLSLASSDQIMIKVMDWKEALRVGVQLMREATRLMPND